MTQPRLRDRVGEADAERFVGREVELALVDRVLVPGGSERILLVHGPGGIGKSALLRAAARHGATAGYLVRMHDGRAVPLAFDRLVAEVLPEEGSQPPLVVLDEADHLGANLAVLRDVLLEQLPPAARIIVSMRSTPDSGWRRGGLDAITAELALGPLSDEEALLLLAERGVAEPEQRRVLADWAAGSPLALTVASASEQDVPRGPRERVLDEQLSRWLAGRELDAIDPEVLEVVAVTWAVDARLLAAALPARRTREAMAQLAALSVVQLVGGRAVLHPVLARAIRARMQAENPGRLRELTGRIAEHLATRAALGQTHALLELAELVQDPTLRAGMSLAASKTHYADALRRGDLDSLGRALGLSSEPRWPFVVRGVEALADYATIVRHVSGDIDALGLFASFDALRAVSADDPAAAEVVDAALEAGCDPGRTVLGMALIVGSGPRYAEAMRAGNGSAIMRAGIPDVRWTIVHYPAPVPRPTDYLAAAGYQPLGTGPAGGTFVADYGPGGLIGFVRDTVLAEQGRAPRSDGVSVLLARTDDPVREAQLRAVLDEVFGNSAEDRRLRRIIELAHLGARRSEAEALAALHTSRTSYYRLLRQARERLLAHG